MLILHTFAQEKVVKIGLEQKITCNATAIREAAEKVIFLTALPLRGGGGKALALALR